MCVVSTTISILVTKTSFLCLSSVLISGDAKANASTVVLCALGVSFSFIWMLTISCQDSSINFNYPLHVPQYLPYNAG